MWPCTVCQNVFTQEAGLLHHMEHMRMDPKHQFAAQYVLSRAAAERREKEANTASSATHPIPGTSGSVGSAMNTMGGSSGSGNHLPSSAAMGGGNHPGDYSLGSTNHPGGNNAVNLGNTSHGNMASTSTNGGGNNDVQTSGPQGSQHPVHPSYGENRT